MNSLAQAATDLYVFFANASKAFAMLASRFLYESDMMWLNNKWLMIDDRDFLKMRHGGEPHTWSVAPGAVHRIYLGRTVRRDWRLVDAHALYAAYYTTTMDSKQTLSKLLRSTRAVVAPP